MTPKILTGAVCALLAFVLPGIAKDWPQFRGPNSTAVAAEATISTEPKIQWSVPLPGRGLASPIIVGDKLFLTCSSGPKQERLHLICFSKQDGSKLWERELLATGRTMAHPKTSVAACTPCSDGSRVFAIWSSNDVAAFDLEGNLLWVRGLTSDYPNVSNSLGMASSPLIVGDTLVTMIENDSESYSVGLDANTGRNLWKLDRPKSANWTSPVVWNSGSGEQVVLLQSSKGITAVQPKTGITLWDYSEGASTSSSSVIADGVIYAPSQGITALVPAESGRSPTQLWRSKQINPATISPVVLGGRVFSINNAGVIATADAKTGTVGWKLRLAGPFSGSPVGAGKHLVAVNEKGLLQIVDVSGAEGVIAGQLQLPVASKEDLVLCTPAISGEHVFVRSDSTLWRIGS